MSQLSRPEKINQFLWVERSGNMAPFLGPYDTLEEALQGVTAWKNEGGLLTPEHTEIFLIVSVRREGCLMWDISLPRTKLGMLLW